MSAIVAVLSCIFSTKSLKLSYGWFSIIFAITEFPIPFTALNPNRISFLSGCPIKLSLDCPCDAIQNGLNELEFANLLTNQQLNKYCNEKDIHEIRKLCQLYEEWIKGESSKTQHFYSQLEKTCSIPSMIQRKYDKDIHMFCRLYFIFHIHNLSLSFL